MAWPGQLLVPIPDAVGPDDAALLEPLGVALHAMDLAKVERATSASVVGCGPIGLLLIQALAAGGCERIAAVELLGHRREAALAAGATRATAGWPTDEALVDVAFEAAGEDDAVGVAVESVRPGGRVVLVGIPGGDATSFPASTARRKGLTILLSRRMAAGDLERAVALSSAGKVRPGRIVTARHPLEQVDAAFGSLVGRDGLKIVVVRQAGSSAT
jgi:L-iditol 2-dehydrogenase